MIEYHNWLPLPKINCARIVQHLIRKMQQKFTLDRTRMSIYIASCSQLRYTNSSGQMGRYKNYGNFMGTKEIYGETL